MLTMIHRTQRAFNKLSRLNTHKALSNVPSPPTEGNNTTRKRKDRKTVFRNKLPEVKFESYITEEDCLKGLQSSELIAGVLRINAKRHRDAYIDAEESLRGIYIKGTERRNRALPGDIVAVKLLPSSTENNENFPKKGEVVYIIQEKHSRVAAGHLKPYRDHKYGFALMTPIDRRLPQLMIPINECPPDFVARPKDCEKTIFVAKISSWGMNMAFAPGKLIQSLGDAGHIEPETEAILLSNKIDSSEFKKDVLNCLPDGDTWKITAEELSKRKDLRNECIFTIDPATAQDLDDALSCKKIGEDLYEVGVHIADVSHFIAEGSALDNVAKKRATSVYLVQKVIHMLPRVLCEKLCSLNPGVERLTYSVIWNIKSDGTVVSEWFGRTVIRSCVKLSYDHAQQLIESADKEPSPKEYPPVTGNFTLNKISEIVKDLYKISVHLRKHRFDSGAFNVNIPKIAFTMDSESGLPNGCRVYEIKESNKLIEEFMLLANMAVGRKILQVHPEKAILRHHDPPDKMKMADLDKLCKAYDIPFDPSDSASVNASLQKTMCLAPELQHIHSVLTLMTLKTFQLAKYFCAGSINDVSKYRHYGLNVPIYTHFTSPIRRYPDVLVHRLLTASLDKSFKVNETKMQVIANDCNERKLAAKNADEKSIELFFAVYVKECGPLAEKGVVIDMKNGQIHVLSTRLGIVFYVKLDKSPVYEYNYRTEGVKKYLTLYWQDSSDNLNDNIACEEVENKDDKGVMKEASAIFWDFITKKLGNIPHEKLGNIPREEVKTRTKQEQTRTKQEQTRTKQELTIFSPVDVILSVEESAPTTILAHLVNPHDSIEHPEHGL